MEDEAVVLRAILPFTDNVRKAAVLYLLIFKVSKFVWEFCLFSLTFDVLNKMKNQEHDTLHPCFLEIQINKIFLQGVQRNPGDKWMLKGPREFCPTVEMEVVSKRKAIPLDANEGVYVRNVKTGKVCLKK